jgi:putative transposase
VIEFIATHRGRRTQGLRWGFEPICRVLEISPSTVRSAIARPACARRVADEALKVTIRKIWDENYQVYGIRKIRAVLAREGERVAKNRVARLMHELGIRGATRGRKVHTTRPDSDHVRAPDLVKRDFTAPAPNRLWVMDFTYVPTWAGMVYVAFVIDVYSRMIVGWNLATTMRTDLVMTALEQAVWRRDTLLDELITHSDAGSQYTAIRFTDRLVEIGARPSIGTVGDSYDNAMAESVNGLYKTELVWRRGPWRTAEQLELATLLYVEWFNQRRIHAEIGDLTPAEFEAAHYRQQHPSTINA